MEKKIKEWDGKTDELIKADSGRYTCTSCSCKINKYELFFRDSKSGYRSSHTVNLCYKCITALFLKLNVDNKEVGNIRKILILKKL